MTSAVSVLLLVTAGALLLSGAGAGAGAGADPAAAEPRTSFQRIDGAGVSLDSTLYLPVDTPAPAVLVAHGFGGSKATADDDARVFELPEPIQRRSQQKVTFVRIRLKLGSLA